MGSAAAVAVQPVPEEPETPETKNTDSIKKTDAPESVQKPDGQSAKPSPFPRKLESQKPLESSKQTEETLAAGALALGFTNRQLVHRIPEKAITTTFEGSIVVMADCGRMAYPMSGKPAAEAAHCEPCHAG